MAGDLQSCPEVHLGASGSELCAVPMADQPMPSLIRAKHGCASAERWRRAQGCLLCLGAWLLLLRVCSPWAIKGLVRQDSCGLCSLPSCPCFSGLWRTSCRGIFVSASEVLSWPVLTCVLSQSCSAFLPKQGCSSRLVSAPVIHHSSNGKPFRHGVARNRWSPDAGGH